MQATIEETRSEEKIPRARTNKLEEISKKEFQSNLMYMIQDSRRFKKTIDMYLKIYERRFQEEPDRIFIEVYKNRLDDYE